MKIYLLVYIYFTQYAFSQQAVITKDTTKGQKLAKELIVSFTENGENLEVRIENKSDKYYVISKTPYANSQSVTLKDGSKSGSGSTFMSDPVYHDHRILIPSKDAGELGKFKVHTIKSYREHIKDKALSTISLRYGILTPGTGEYSRFDLEISLVDKVEGDKK